MNTLHDLATQNYTEHYARMNSTLVPAEMPESLYQSMELMFGPLVDHLEEGDALVDIGCGTGFLLHWLERKPGLRLHGVDVCDTQVELARCAVPRADITSMDAIGFLEDNPERFEGAFCLDVLEHMETGEQCLALLKGAFAALRPGGFFLCRVPNAAHILGSYGRYMDITHHRSFTSHSLRQALTAAGFENVRLVQTRSVTRLGKLRLALEHLLHLALFRMGGYTMERTFTQNVIAVGFRP